MTTIDERVAALEVFVGALASSLDTKVNGRPVVTGQVGAGTAGSSPGTVPPSGSGGNGGTTVNTGIGGTSYGLGAGGSAFGAQRALDVLYAGGDFDAFIKRRLLDPLLFSADFSDLEARGVGAEQGVSNLIPMGYFSLDGVAGDDISASLRYVFYQHIKLWSFTNNTNQALKYDVHSLDIGATIEFYTPQSIEWLLRKTRLDFLADQVNAPQEYGKQIILSLMLTRLFWRSDYQLKSWPYYHAGAFMSVWRSKGTNPVEMLFNRFDPSGNLTQGRYVNEANNTTINQWAANNKAGVPANGLYGRYISDTDRLIGLRGGAPMKNFSWLDCFFLYGDPAKVQGQVFSKDSLLEPYTASDVMPWQPFDTRSSLLANIRLNGAS